MDGHVVGGRTGERPGTGPTTVVEVPGSTAVVLEVDIGAGLDGDFRVLRDVLGSGAVDPVAVAAVMARHGTAAVRS